MDSSYIFIPFGYVKNCKIRAEINKENLALKDNVIILKDESEIIENENIDNSSNKVMMNFYRLINKFENNVRLFITKECMETVISFSASLISSLGGDTEKAVQYTGYGYY